MFLKKIQFQMVLSGSWMLLKYNRQRPLRSLTQEAKLCFVKQTKKHLKIIQFPAVWNWLLLYTGAWPELHLQDMHAEWERNHRILKHSTKSNPNKESVAQIGDATSMSNVSESAGKTNIKHKLLLESIQSHEGFRNLMTEGWGQSKTCVGSSPICPGVASASLCIRESSVRGDMGNRSLVFPEFVLRKKGKKRILLDKLRSQWNRFIITERVCCRTADNLSPISLSVFVLITEVKAASLIQNFYTEHRSDVNESQRDDRCWLVQEQRFLLLRYFCFPHTKTVESIPTFLMTWNDDMIVWTANVKRRAWWMLVSWKDKQEVYGWGGAAMISLRPTHETHRVTRCIHSPTCHAPRAPTLGIRSQAAHSPASPWTRRGTYEDRSGSHWANFTTPSRRPPTKSPHDWLACKHSPLASATLTASS